MGDNYKVRRVWRMLVETLAAVGLFVAAGVLASPAQAETWCSSAGCAYDPSPATNISAVAGPGTLTVSWTAPNPGLDYYGTPATISGYQVQANVAGGSYAAGTCYTSSTSCTIKNLDNGVDTWIQVAAYTESGRSFNSGNGPWKPCCEVPTAPQNVYSSISKTTARVAWTAPSNATAAGTNLQYQVNSTPATTPCITSSLSCDIAGLIPGTGYTFSVTAASNAGTSPAGTSASVTAQGPPTSPQGVTAKLGTRGTAAISWDAPMNSGGSPITSYAVTATPGGQACMSTGATSCVVTGLTNGTAYTFSVVASNALGASPAASSGGSKTLMARPSAPRNAKARLSRGSVIVTWSAPASLGGTRLTGYQVTSPQMGASCKTPKTSCTIKRLAAGGQYSFLVAATNAQGAGAQAPTNTVKVPGAKPVTRPTTPTTPATPAEPTPAPSGLADQNFH